MTLPVQGDGGVDFSPFNHLTKERSAMETTPTTPRGNMPFSMENAIIPQKRAEENGRQYAYRTLYENIMALRFPPGMTLSDADLSDALQISRTPIREAIVSLVESKLVEVYPQRGSIVSRIDLDAVEEGVFLRFNTERAILQEAIKKADGEDLSRLYDNLKQQKEALDTEAPDAYMDLDNRFHHLLYLTAEKPWTWTAVMRIVTHQDRVRRLQVHQGTQALWTAYEEHTALFHAIMSRSDKNMDEFLYEHLTSGYRRALPQLLEKYPSYFSL